MSGSVIDENYTYFFWLLDMKLTARSVARGRCISILQSPDPTHEKDPEMSSITSHLYGPQTHSFPCLQSGLDFVVHRETLTCYCGSFRDMVTVAISTMIP